MASKMGKRNNILRSLSGRSWGQKKETLRQLYMSYTLAAADYNLAAWGPAAPPSTLEILEKKQNIAARIITGCAPDTPIVPLLAEAGLMKIQDRVAIQTVIQHEKTIRLPDNIPSKYTATRTEVKIKFAEFKKPEKKMCPPPQRDSYQPPDTDGTREDPKRGSNQIPCSSSLGVGGHHDNNRGDLHHT